MASLSNENLSLLATTHHNVAMTIRQHHEVNNFENGVSQVGRGATMMTRTARIRVKEVKARALGSEIEPGSKIFVHSEKCLLIIKLNIR